MSTQYVATPAMIAAAAAQPQPVDDNCRWAVVAAGGKLQCLTHTQAGANEVASDLRARGQVVRVFECTLANRLAPGVLMQSDSNGVVRVESAPRYVEGGYTVDVTGTMFDGNQIYYGVPVTHLKPLPR